MLSFAQIALKFQIHQQAGECSLVGMLLGMFCQFDSSCHPCQY